MLSIARQNAGDPDYTTFQYRELHKDGHYVWIECRGACVERDESGQPAVLSAPTPTSPPERRRKNASKACPGA